LPSHQRSQSLSHGNTSNAAAAAAAAQAAAAALRSQSQLPSGLHSQLHSIAPSPAVSASAAVAPTVAATAAVTEAPSGTAALDAFLNMNMNMSQNVSANMSAAAGKANTNAAGGDGAVLAPLVAAALSQLQTQQSLLLHVLERQDRILLPNTAASVNNTAHNTVVEAEVKPHLLQVKTPVKERTPAPSPKAQSSSVHASPAPVAVPAVADARSAKLSLPLPLTPASAYAFAHGHDSKRSFNFAPAPAIAESPAATAAPAALAVPSAPVSTAPSPRASASPAAAGAATQPNAAGGRPHHPAFRSPLSPSAAERERQRDREEQLRLQQLQQLQLQRAGDSEEQSSRLQSDRESELGGLTSDDERGQTFLALVDDDVADSSDDDAYSRFARKNEPRNAPSAKNSSSRHSAARPRARSSVTTPSVSARAGLPELEPVSDADGYDAAADAAAVAELSDVASDADTDSATARPAYATAAAGGASSAVTVDAAQLDKLVATAASLTVFSEQATRSISQLEQENARLKQQLLSNSTATEAGGAVTTVNTDWSSSDVDADVGANNSDGDASDDEYGRANAAAAMSSAANESAKVPRLDLPQSQSPSHALPALPQAHVINHPSHL